MSAPQDRNPGESAAGGERVAEPCDHEWQLQDDSFDHEFGTEKVIYLCCEKCGAEKPYKPW